MKRLVDVVTARALRHALQPGPVPGSAAMDLALLARNDHRILDRALRRIEFGLAERSSRTGRRAQETLERARKLVRDDAGALAVTVRSTVGRL